MSGVCGIIDFNNRPVHQETLEKMVEFISYRGPDGINYWVEGNVGMVNLALNTTPESLWENQPLLSKDENLILTADARVDNREELISALRDNGYIKEKKHTDADLILAAYECWEEYCPKHIMGDFTFVLWDRSKEKLFIARDTFGARPFFYSIQDNVLYFASAVQPIAQTLPTSPSLNMQLMDDFLHRSFNLWACQTIFNGIFRLPPSHFLTIVNGQRKRKLYHVFGQQPKPNFSSDQEWIDAFGVLLEEILINQLRSNTPVGLWVSGGLDSSALACQIYDLKKKHPNLPEIKLISSIFEETPSADEKDYFDLVAEYCQGTPVKYVVSDDCWPFGELGKDGGFPLDEPEIWEYRGHSQKVMKATKKEGCNVYLGGGGSDDLIGTSFYRIPSALRDVKLKNWKQEVQWFHEKGFSWKNLFFKAYLLPLIPRNLTYKVSMLWNRRKLPWLNQNYIPSHLNHCKLDEEFINPKNFDNYGFVACQMLKNPWLISGYDFYSLLNAYTGIELRQPYFDRRMVEFLIRIPSHLRSFEGVDRVLLRELMKGKLPEIVRTRKDKTSSWELYRSGFQKEKKHIKGLFQDSKLEKMDLVNSKVLKNEFELLLSGKYDNIKYVGGMLSLKRG
ncbi:asparagine synthetase B family protein [Methanobacterium petrolearium]|uniref:asparagine synthetase B family protein n=1 Tax=Methanobacterium petrolearium TaxID=710190 RepID=UPI00308185D8|nr:asparagine synthetase B [Methanobacterium petrolearium]